MMSGERLDPCTSYGYGLASTQSLVKSSHLYIVYQFSVSSAKNNIIFRNLNLLITISPNVVR